jgi:hypothetical protein
MNMRSEVLLSINRALWEQVTPDLRGVAAWCEGTLSQGCVRAGFLYEGPVGELQAECTSLAESYCIADFPPQVTVRFEAVPHADLDVLDGEFWVYLRWEES